MASLSTSTNVPFTTTAISSTPPISQSPAGSGVGLTIGVCVLVMLVVTLVVLVTAIAIYRRKTAGKTIAQDRGDTLQTKDNVAYIPNTNIVTTTNESYATNAEMDINPAYTKHISTQNIATTTNESYATNAEMAVNPAYGCKKTSTHLPTCLSLHNRGVLKGL